MWGSSSLLLPVIPGGPQWSFQSLKKATVLVYQTRKWSIKRMDTLPRLALNRTSGSPQPIALGDPRGRLVRLCFIRLIFHGYLGSVRLQVGPIDWKQLSYGAIVMQRWRAAIDIPHCWEHDTMVMLRRNKSLELIYFLPMFPSVSLFSGRRCHPIP